MTRSWKEIKRRIVIEWNAFGRQHNVMKGNIPLLLKRKMYNECFEPVLTYGSETWSLTKDESVMERIMFGIT